MSLFGINHTRKDDLLIATMNMPGTGKTEYSDVLDLTQPGGIDEAIISVEHSAMPSLADTKKAAITIQESEDGSTWTDVPGTTLETVGSGSSGAIAKGVRMRIPLDIGPFIRLKVVMDASSGDNTAATVELAICV